MNRVQVYDLPTRLFHGLFAGGFVIAFFIAKVVDDESPAYAYHMLLGFILAGMVGLRFLWGVFGSRYARFSSFALHPFDLIRYFQKILGAKPFASLGRNPATSWAALLMMALALGLAITGYWMTAGGNHETLEDVHELLANTFAITAILHVAGVFFHTFRHGDAMAMSMVHGKKTPVEGRIGIEKTYRGVGVLFLFLVGAFGLQLHQNYDRSTRVLRLFGNSLRLGDSEDEKANSEGRMNGSEGKESDQEDDDDER